MKYCMKLIKHLNPLHSYCIMVHMEEILAEEEGNQTVVSQLEESVGQFKL